MRINLPTISDRKLFGFMIVGAYILSLGTLAFVPIPEVNSEYFGQLMMGLVGAVGVIVGAIWKTTASEERTQQVERETMRTLADKVPPPTGAADTVNAGQQDMANRAIDAAAASQPLADVETSKPSSGAA
jgi:hypothetical protein